MFTYGREVCGQFDVSSRREWLVTNGIGGYASGTIAGVLTRHYHGLLAAALKPPLERTVTLVKLDENIVYDDRIYPLFTNQWEDGGVEPLGFLNIEKFYLEGTTPVWCFAVGDALLQKRIWMEQGENTTYIQYSLVRANAPMQLTLKALVNFRNHHEGVSSNHQQFHLKQTGNGVRVQAHDSTTPYFIQSDKAEFYAKGEWYHGYYKAVEAYRGTETPDDNFYAGDFEIRLHPDESFVICVSFDENTVLDGAAAYQRRQQYEEKLITLSGLLDAPEEVKQLVLASDQFIVKREEGHSVIAGYPWFGDWGRDTMIALPGLTLTTRRFDIAASILRNFARFVDQGMLPNRFPDEGDQPEYNTVDATLWYFEAIRAYHAATGDTELVKDLYPVLKDIIDWHIKGTRYGIKVDPDDGLLYSGEEGVQLTWMDVKIDEWVVTPRTGKAVEINALWYNALCIMADFAAVLSDDSEPFKSAASRVKQSFQRFWNGEYLADVIDSPDAEMDNSLRPNQLIAVALHHTPVDRTQWKNIVDVCAQKLLTSHGLRSLSPDNPEYIGMYGGNRFERDRAYHQGTVWSWLIGPFVDAHLRAYNDPQAAYSFLEPLLMSMNDGAIGNISEIFDGDAPFRPRGAFAQAWGVAELLRTSQRIQSEYR